MAHNRTVTMANIAITDAQDRGTPASFISKHYPGVTLGFDRLRPGDCE